MNKKLLITIGILVIIIALLGVYVIHIHKPAPTEEQLLERFSEFSIQYDEKKAQGFDIAEAEALARQAKQAYNKKDYETANVLLDKAFEALKKAKIPAMSETLKEEAKNKLSQVKVAILYQRVTDGIYYLNKSVNDVINILKETKTDFIFRAWWRWHPIPESPEEQPGFFTSGEIEEATRRGLTYEHLRNAIAEIKNDNPDIVFCGAVGLPYLNAKRERNPLTGETFGQEETWDMALDPRKWNISVSKEEFQCWVAKELVWVNPSLDCRDYDPQKVPFYFPDITNPDFQELFLSWVKKQIDCGADAIWIDMLFSQAGRLLRITKDPYHPAVRESFEAASEMVDKIHEYGLSKGRYIYVGTWDEPIISMPYSPPNLDFVTLAKIPSSREVYLMKLDEGKYDERIAKIREKLGDIYILAFMDFGFPNSPMEIFSQNLTPEEQREFLRIADEFLQKRGINFIYPVHGGNIGITGVENIKILSFKKFNVYDSFAPEFQTYETIKELAQKKSR